MKRRVTVTLPEDLITFVDRLAAEQGVSRSQVIVDLLTGSKNQHEEEFAAEGYIFYGPEATEFAQMSQQASFAAWNGFQME